LGQAASLNLGISKVTSEFIAFIDSDDLWFSGKVEKQVKMFHEKPDVGLVYTNGYVIDENDKIMYELLPADFLESNILGDILLKCYIRTPSSVMVRRKIFEDTKLFKTHIFSTDHDMWVRMAEVTKFYYLPEHVTGYRKRSGSISTTRRLWEDGFIILKDACERYPYGLNIRRKRLAILYYRLGEFDWRHGNYYRSLLDLFLSGVLDPFRALGVISTKIKNDYI
jgi:glycosyltransferase involved in cell wall biosynthesis